MYTLNEGEIIDSFQSLLGDLETITYASYFCELIDIAMTEEESNREIFKDLVAAFYFMKNKVGDLETLARIFELKVLKATGYGLNLDTCCICRNKINSSNYMSLQYLGGVCENCESINGMHISNAAYNILKYLNKLPLEKSYRVTIPKSIKGEIYKVLSTIISQNYFKKPKSLETLNFIKGSGENE